SSGPAIEKKCESGRTDSRDIRSAGRNRTGASSARASPRSRLARGGGVVWNGFGNGLLATEAWRHGKNGWRLTFDGWLTIRRSRLRAFYSNNQNQPSRLGFPVTRCLLWQD